MNISIAKERRGNCKILLADKFIVIYRNVKIMRKYNRTRANFCRRSFRKYWGCKIPKIRICRLFLSRWNPRFKSLNLIIKSNQSSQLSSIRSLLSRLYCICICPKLGIPIRPTLSDVGRTYQRYSWWHYQGIVFHHNF